MAQQTAVEWLAKNLKDFPHIKHSQSFKELIKQAKQMEQDRRREDVKIGYNQGYLDAQCNHVNDADNFASEQEYINNK